MLMPNPSLAASSTPFADSLLGHQVRLDPGPRSHSELERLERSLR